ncbi:hypothetical protein G7007_18820 [Pseudomonas entomophila]|uniref:hypothetical protein n=1 Tax=Pseudomonas entomophila TaxID=312306 RepID=UPI0015E2821B|nr:hypothetical protein [Pseudomonas entomophila]EKT4458353.1 hypothetical protein [Pseudomonas putida]MBA1194882.1 hypothetical protein [Pseudomonas entomophila]
MIGDDDFETFFDPDEFGAVVVLVEPGQQPRDLAGMFGKPAPEASLYRGGIDPGAANVRGRAAQEHFHIATRQLPANWRTAKVLVDGAEFSIANAQPFGRLRTVLTLVPYGDRAAPAGERGKWQASN